MDNSTQGGATPDDKDAQDEESNVLIFARCLDELVSRLFNSAESLATALHVRNSTISNWRNGDHCPRNERMATKLADELEKKSRELGMEFSREKFMQLWRAADKERRQRQGKKPSKQSPGIAPSLEPVSARPDEEGTIGTTGPGTGRLELASTTNLQTSASQGAGTPTAQDISEPHRRRTRRILMGLAVLAVVFLSLVVLWPSSRPPGPPRASTITLYRIDADEAKGAHVHELPQYSSADQQFRAIAPKIVEFAVIIGHKEFDNKALIGRVKFELLDCTSERVERDVDALNNIDTVVSFDQPISVNRGQICTLRVTNLAPRILGFWFNDNPNPENTTVLHGAKDPPGASAPEEHALSGHVLGQS